MTKRLGTHMWLWYLTAGVLLAVTRVVVFMWVNHRHALDIYTETDTFIVRWLYPEAAVSIVWPSLAGSSGTNLVWCSLFTLGSFVMTTPILLVAWLRQRRR
jgi:hypothetical protein